MKMTSMRKMRTNLKRKMLQLQNLAKGNDLRSKKMTLTRKSSDSIKLALPYQIRCTSMRKLGRRYELQLMNCPIAYVSQLMLQNYQRIKKKMMTDDIKQKNLKTM